MHVNYISWTQIVWFTGAISTQKKVQNTIKICVSSGKLVLLLVYVQLQAVM